MSGINVDATAVRPAGVSTKMTATGKEGKNGTLSPTVFAEVALNKVTSVLCYGHIMHEISGTIVDNISDVWPGFSEMLMSKICAKVRSNAIARQ